MLQIEIIGVAIPVKFYTYLINWTGTTLASKTEVIRWVSILQEGVKGEPYMSDLLKRYSCRWFSKLYINVIVEIVRFPLFNFNFALFKTYCEIRLSLSMGVGFWSPSFMYSRKFSSSLVSMGAFLIPLRVVNNQCGGLFVARTDESTQARFAFRSYRGTRPGLPSRLLVGTPLACGFKHLGFRSLKPIFVQWCARTYIVKCVCYLLKSWPSPQD